MIVYHDELMSKGLTQKHLDFYNNTMLPVWMKTEPESFGELLPKGLEFVGFTIRETDDVPPFEQIHRETKSGSGDKRGNKNPKKVEIAGCIRDNGYKLKYVPPAVLLGKPAHDEEWLTGNTRGEIFKDEYFKNIIVSEYKFTGTEAQREEAIIKAGQIFNTTHDPASPPAKENIIKAMIKLGELYKTTKGQAGVNPKSIDQLVDLAEELCGKGVFRLETRTDMAYVVYNLNSPDQKIISWSATGVGRKYNTNSERKTYNLIDNDNVRYLVSETGSPTKSFASVINTLEEYPDCEVRLVCHTSTLTSYDIHNTYKNRIHEYIEKMKGKMNQVKRVFGDKNKQFERVVFWGAYPAMQEHHDLGKLVRISKDCTQIYQGEGLDGHYREDIGEE